MDDETTQNQRLRAIRLDDEAQVRRWATILGPASPRRLSRRLSPYLKPGPEPARQDRPGIVGIGGRPGA